MTKTEKIIQELTTEVTIRKERVENVRGEIAGISSLVTQVALLQQRVDDFREGWKTWAQRLWMILAPIAEVVIGYYLSGRR